MTSKRQKQKQKKKKKKKLFQEGKKQKHINP